MSDHRSPPDEREATLRRLLFLRHGCSGHVLYGDDGEMQCAACMIDFRRDTPEQIEKRFQELALKKLAQVQSKGLVPCQACWSGNHDECYSNDAFECLCGKKGHPAGPYKIP